ncbi:SCO4848 family membrane protein [Nocardioides sp. NPDC057767]|uniref:SCO4848 family membrane protein n=1 Tax=unclassified Nocardioides TaxID=2615069 RepID=UPI00366D7E35
MKLEKTEGALLLVIGIWTIAIWTNFGRNLVKTATDPEQTRPKPYYVAHAVLVVVDVLLGGLLVKLGVQRLLTRG